jgi:hypothetical protein
MSFTSMLLIIAAVVAAGLVLARVVAKGLVRRRAEVRRLGLASALSSRGLQPAEGGDGVDAAFLSRFSVGRDREGARVEDCHVAEAGAGGRIWLLTFSHAVRGQRGAWVRQRHTLALVRSPGLRLPEFLLAPQGLVPDRPGIAPVPEVDLSIAPGLAGRMVCRSADPSIAPWLARNAAELAAALLPGPGDAAPWHRFAWFWSVPRLVAEGAGDGLIVYRLPQPLPARDWSAFAGMVRGLAARLSA